MKERCVSSRIEVWQGFIPPRRVLPWIVLAVGLLAGCTTTEPQAGSSITRLVQEDVPTTDPTVVGTTSTDYTGSRRMDAPPTTTPATTLVPPAEPPFAVGKASLTFEDTSRGTEPNRSQPAAPTRVIPTTIYYPAVGAPGGEPRTNASIVRGRPFPMLVFAHGTSMTGERYELLLYEFAKSGFLVVAPNLPITNAAAPGGPNPDGYRQQPGDISFVITSMLTMNATAGHVLEGRIDPERIGVFGQSTGGDDALALTHDCCRDGRVKAIAALAGSQWLRRGVPNFPIDGYFAGPPIPLLLIHGDRDQVTPFSDSTAVFKQAPSPKYRLTMLGADHLSPSGANGHNRWFEVSVRVLRDFFAAYVIGYPLAAEQLKADGEVAGVAHIEAS
ncbi:MAG: hypothetical protein N2037_11345 [Acidimicrobiales bacterium]|nr:hypothetical protein [Acidimicrobiales bacterium]